MFETEKGKYLTYSKLQNKGNSKAIVTLELSKDKEGMYIHASLCLKGTFHELKQTEIEDLYMYLIATKSDRS